jgi:hypothetical protein
MSKAKKQVTEEPNLIKTDDIAEQPIDSDVLRDMIAEAAYFKAEKRGFVPGDEMEDWLKAEKEILGTSSKQGDENVSAAEL